MNEPLDRWATLRGRWTRWVPEGHDASGWLERVEDEFNVGYVREC